MPGKPQTRRYSPEEKASAVRAGAHAAGEAGADYRTVRRAAAQLGCRVGQCAVGAPADIDDEHAVGVSNTESARIR